ncbi:hypothetical protein BYT27DRAFT_7248173 [Phlegmacium glaucopus]|nr:hypothetical protein BYT27DRAFT_7248173 [Phlegmacium glaucopus]
MEQIYPADVAHDSVGGPQGQPVSTRLHGGYRVREYKGKRYIVPDFLAPSTEQALAAIKMKEQMDCIDATFEPCNNNGQPSSTITAGLIRTPLDPSLTHREALMIHAEIKALAQRLGLSYKDAAHRLYMAKVERVKLADSAAKSFAILKQKIDKMVSHELCPVIDAIDRWDLDDFTVKDGYWSK